MKIKQNILQNMAKTLKNPDNMRDSKLIKVFRNIQKVMDTSDVYAGFEEDGRFISSSLAKLKDGFDPRKQGWYKRVKISKKNSISDIYFNNTTKKRSFAYMVKMRNDDSDFIGVLASVVDFKKLDKMIKNIKIDGGYSYLLDQNYKILSYPAKNIYLESFVEKN